MKMTTDMTTSSKQQLSTAQKQEADFKSYLMRGVDSLRRVASKFMDPQRLVSIALVARARTPLLMKCSNESILLSLMQAAEMGLEPNTPLQHAALVPRKNKQTGGYECQFMPMYRGLIELGRRSGVLRTARAVPIYTCDEYAIVEGLVHTIEHKPHFTHADFGDPSKVVMIYAVAQLVGGDIEWTYMTTPQIRRIQNRSPAGSSGPWQTDWEEMAKKTVIRRLAKMLPLSNELAKAIEIGGDGDDEHEGVDLSMVAAAAAHVADQQADDDKVIDIREATPQRDGGAELAEAIKKVEARKTAKETPSE